MMNRSVAEVIAGHPVVSLPARAHAREAADRMAAKHVASVVVVDDQSHVVGIFTERDLTVRVVSGRLDPDSTPLAEVMTPTPVTTAPETLVGEALRVMNLNGMRHLPVVDAERTVLGVVSTRDFIGVELAHGEREYETMQALTEHIA